MATKIKGKKYKRVKMNKAGTCPPRSTKMARGKSRRASCYQLVKAK
jgi:hypothetical protein